MPFERDRLWVLTFARGFTLWRYRSPDREAGEGYFDPAHDLLHRDDLILACLGDGPTARVGIFRVTASAGGAVQFDDLSPPPGDQPALPSEPNRPEHAAPDSHAGRRRLARLARLAGDKEYRAHRLRNADNTARAERVAGDAELDAAAIRWALGRLEPDPERACVEGFFQDLSRTGEQTMICPSDYRGEG